MSNSTAIKNKEVSLVLNTPSPLRDSRADDSSIRKAAIKHKTPYDTTLAAATATVHGIAAAQQASPGSSKCQKPPEGCNGSVRSLQSYHESIG